MDNNAIINTKLYINENWLLLQSEMLEEVVKDCGSLGGPDESHLLHMATGSRGAAAPPAAGLGLRFSFCPSIIPNILIFCDYLLN